MERLNQIYCRTASQQWHYINSALGPKLWLYFPDLTLLQYALNIELSDKHLPGFHRGIQNTIKMTGWFEQGAKVLSQQKTILTPNTTTAYLPLPTSSHAYTTTA